MGLVTSDLVHNGKITCRWARWLRTSGQKGTTALKKQQTHKTKKKKV
jgi:hypothetical protein